jgi:hypothetical protein
MIRPGFTHVLAYNPGIWAKFIGATATESVRDSRTPGKLSLAGGSDMTNLAEGKGFEPLVRGYRTLVFKTSSLGRSDNLPCLVVFHRELAAPKTCRRD